MRPSDRPLWELNDFNAIACLMVILIHVLSLGISNADPTAPQAFFIYLPWRLSAFVVPAFLFSGAVKIALHSDAALTAAAYGRYVLHRFRKIYLPFVIWNVIYYLVFLPIHYVNGSIGEFLRYLWYGNLSSPFYYVLIVMQFYLLLPVWVWLIRRVPAVPAIFCAFLVSLLFLRIGAVLEIFGISFAYGDRIFPTYLCFWVMGLYAGKHYTLLKEHLTRISLLFAAVPVCFFALVAYLQYAKGVYFLDLNPVKLCTDTLSIWLLLGLCLMIREKLPHLSRPLGYIYRASFFVYLSHCLFLTVGTVFFQRIGITALTPLLALRALVCYSVPFLLFFFWEKAKHFISSPKTMSKA